MIVPGAAEHTCKLSRCEVAQMVTSTNQPNKMQERENVKERPTSSIKETLWMNTGPVGHPT
jgi:hypothetical protein